MTLSISNSVASLITYFTPPSTPTKKIPEEKYRSTWRIITPTPNGPREERVKFDTKVLVILIPSREEYNDAKLTKKLWHQEDDYTQFKKDAGKELRKRISRQALKGRHISAETAIKELYKNKSTLN